ncbi:hypothetical protein scyTo_0010993, partial [Scyliorhinus torazame]|nr:hypothetical protein [Scyliorhinus torazame]
VTLIHSTYVLGDSEVLPSVRRGVKEILINKGAHLLLGQKVNNLAGLIVNKAQKDMRVLTNKGQEITTDMVICCTGIRINSSAYASALKDKLNEHDAIIVDEHLNVKGTKIIFAIGDCANVNEHKSAYTAEFQAIACVKNIVHSLRHEPMESYKPGRSAASCPSTPRVIMGGTVSVDGSVHVVIVGGGFGGIAAGNHLKSYSIPFTLIDMKDAFHHNPGALRASVESGFAKKTLIPFAKTFAKNFKQGKVIDIDLGKQDVILESGEIVHFSHLILATGSSGPFPGKLVEAVTMENAIQMYEDLVEKVHEALRVVVIGGGSAGVEMAAEIKTDYPGKEKVINLQDLVMNEMQNNMKVVTDKGLEIMTDMVICCTGIRINSSAYANAFKNQLAENGALLVNEYLQVNGMENVYAIGDCADVKEPKMAYHAGLHGVVAVDNIVNSLGKTSLKVYKPGSLTMLLSMGRNNGIGQINGWHVGKFVVVMAKSKDLLVWKSWKEMGQTAPH